MSIVSRELTMIFIHLGIILISYNAAVNSQSGFPPEYSPNQHHTPQPTRGPVYSYTQQSGPIFRYCYTDQECWKLGDNVKCNVEPGHSQG